MFFWSNLLFYYHLVQLLTLAILFSQDDELQVKVNKLSSTKTQLPYDYYFLDYCKPSKIMNSAENLGEVLRGDRIENSVYTVSIDFLPVYLNKVLLLDIWTCGPIKTCSTSLSLLAFNQFKMRVDEGCKVSCRVKLNPETAKNFKEKIDDEYRVNM